MTVAPSCRALLIHVDDQFRKNLIATLDQKHFSVTFSEDGDRALEVLKADHPTFRVVVVGLDIDKSIGVKALDYLREHKGEVATCGVLILGEPNPKLRMYAPWADETLMKPVDPDYVAQRARTYCGC